jgi:mannose-6-phosphate isomerase-like protein (cupin superfamily)
MKLLLKLGALLMFLLLAPAAFCQDYVQSLKDVQPDGDYENINVKKVYTDSTVSCFVIWVKESVKPHYHADHTENLVVIEGTAEMTIGDKTYNIKVEDYINIPKGTVHSVKVTSEIPLKVISIQSPEFLGKDRIFVE